MPIDVEQFDAIDEPGGVIERGTNAHKVLTFLLEHDELAFKQGEIAEETGVNTGSISVVLARLEERGLVRHRGQYWTVADDDRVGQYVAMRHSMSVADRTEPAIDKDEWDEYAAEQPDE